MLSKIGPYIFDREKPLGKGQFGIVYKGENAEAEEGDPKEVAIKVYDRTIIKNEEFILREINSLNQFTGDYVIECYDCFKDEKNYFLILEYFDGKSMEERIKNKQPLKVEEAKKLLKRICKAFLSIEDGAVMHRDIKPANILEEKTVDGSLGKTKLLDFGFAKIVDQYKANQKKDHTVEKGTPYYMSPQILNSEDYSCKTDIWSTGITIFELIYCRIPWIAMTPFELLDQIKTTPLIFPKKKEIKELKEEIDDNFMDLLRKMLAIKEEDRPSWKEVDEHPAIEFIDE